MLWVQINEFVSSVYWSIGKGWAYWKSQNQMLPNCYAFDRFNGYAHDGAVVNSLIDHPKSALSVQLISTRLSPEKLCHYTNNTNAWYSQQGVMTQKWAMSAFQCWHYRKHRYYQGSKNNALFSYCIPCLATNRLWTISHQSFTVHWLWLTKPGFETCTFFR